jgi:hypothetical protein
MPLSICLAGADVWSADLALSYDPSILELLDVLPGPAAAGMGFACNTGQAGLVRAALAGAYPLLDDGALLDLHFLVVGGLEPPTDVCFESARLNEGAVASSLHDGRVSQLIIQGDIDRNGCVNVSDFVQVRINLGNAGSAIDPPGADVDGNGIVNVSDLVQVRVSLGEGCK